MSHWPHKPALQLPQRTPSGQWDFSLWTQTEALNKTLQKNGSLTTEQPDLLYVALAYKLGAKRANLLKSKLQKKNFRLWPAPKNPT
jgi:hypothetical protein